MHLLRSCRIFVERALLKKISPMDNSVFAAKFQSLPDELKQQVLQFMDVLLARLKRENELPEDQPGFSFPPDWRAPIVLLQHEGKLLPVTPATEKPDLTALAGIWKDKDITLETLRKEAWGERL
jgi:hypothetical protein